MKSIFYVLILIGTLATLPACKNETPVSNTGTTASADSNNPPIDPANANNQPDTAPIKLDYLPDKLAEVKGCNCNLTDDAGAASEKVLLKFTMTNPATVLINGHLQVMEEQNPVNTAPNHRVIRVFKNENFVVSANLNPKGTVLNEKTMSDYSGEVTIYNLKTKEMVTKNVKGQCGCN